MNVLVLGANGSGKSEYAERIIELLPRGARYYIATMIPYGEEGRRRVEKHRKQREDRAFITLERPFNVSEIQLPQGANVLLEDVSNLLSNRMFDENGDGRGGDVFADITELCGKCANAVLVSIDGLQWKSDYSDETREYIDSLNKINEQLFDFADVVIKMQNGSSDVIKEL